MELDSESKSFPVKTGNIDDLLMHDRTDNVLDVAESEVQLNYVMSGYPGIMAAGCCYPFLISILVTFYFCVVKFRFNPKNIEEGLAAILAVSFFGGAFGLFVSMITGMVSVGLMIIMNWSLGFPLKARFASISAGSLAGYIPTAWVLFAPNFGRQLETSAAMGFLGPLLAMSLGAYGAAVASKHYSGVKPELLARKRKLSLTISQLLIATTWIAVVFATANFLGGIGFAIAVAGWFGLQSLMFGVIWIWRRFR